MIIDLHTHPNLKAFNSDYPEPAANMWDNIHHRIDGSKQAQNINDLTKHIWKESQSNLDRMTAGDVRVFQLSLYPTEKGFLNVRNIPETLFGKRRVNLLQEIITGYHSSSITAQKKNKNYFKELQAEYEYVKSQQGKSPDGKSEFVIVNNYKELDHTLKKKDTLVGIITIEGAHVFNSNIDGIDKMNKQDLFKMLSENIQTAKNWEHPPFIINLSHHFWNYLAGHSKSFKRPINNILNQNKGKNKGITEAGWHVIRELLSTKNGKRILIDTKHMSAASRKEYYAFINNYNYVNPENKIPVVSSHACANGFKTIDSSIVKADLIVKARKGRLYKWSINISDEEAKIIHDSEGLIGLMMDKGNMGGIDVVNEISKEKDIKKQRKLYAQLFWDNAFQFVKAVDKKSGWDMIAVGTDFDGSITHMEPYPTAADLPQFQQDLLTFLEEKKYQQSLWFGYTPKEIVDKMMYGNAMDFYKKFFV